MDDLGSMLDPPESTVLRITIDDDARERLNENGVLAVSGVGEYDTIQINVSESGR